MARALAASPLARDVILAAVAFTMPSVGISLVGRRQCSRTLRSAAPPFVGANKSTAYGRVDTRLVSVSLGAAPFGKVAATIPRASTGLATRRAVPPSARNVLACVLWNGVSTISAAGSQMRVVPDGLRTSTCVVISNVRQSAGCFGSSNPDVFGSARPADRTAEDRRNSRRRIVVFSPSDVLLPDLVVRSRRIVTDHATRPGTIHIRGGKIVGILDFEDVPPGCPLDDAADAAIMPGVVDAHVYVSASGLFRRGAFEATTRAAAAGGVTTIVDMPFGRLPATTTVQALEGKRAAAAQRCYVDVADRK